MPCSVTGVPDPQFSSIVPALPNDPVSLLISGPVFLPSNLFVLFSISFAVLSLNAPLKRSNCLAPSPNLVFTSLNPVATPILVSFNVLSNVFKPTDSA